MGYGQGGIEGKDRRNPDGTLRSYDFMVGRDPKAPLRQLRQEEPQRYDPNLVSTPYVPGYYRGTPFAKLRMMAIYEYTLLGLLAALFGSLFGLGISMMLGLVFFESMAGYEPSVTILSTLAVTALVVLTGTLATTRTLNQSPAKLLAGDR